MLGNHNLNLVPERERDLDSRVHRLDRLGTLLRKIDPRTTISYNWVTSDWLLAKLRDSLLKYCRLNSSHWIKLDPFSPSAQSLAKNYWDACHYFRR